MGRRGPLLLVVRSAAATALVFRFFEALPDYPAGISEAHLILGSTLIAQNAAGFRLCSGQLKRPTTSNCRVRSHEPAALSVTAVKHLLDSSHGHFLFGRHGRAAKAVANYEFIKSSTMHIKINKLFDIQVFDCKMHSKWQW